MKRFRIGAREIGGRHTYVIAEIGSNHDGKLSQARKLIAAAARAGADAVKFQSFVAERLYPPIQFGPRGTAQPHPAQAMLKALEIPNRWYPSLIDHSKKCGVDFLSTPFDEESADRLAEAGCVAIKIASGDLTHRRLLRHVGGLGLPVILSTGMATLGEVERAFAALGKGRGRAALLHCVSNYPPDFSQANVRAVETLRQAFRIPVGQSDHSPGMAIALAAVTLGASIIEKHITLSRDLQGPDHPYAMETGEFADLVREIRNLERALGDGRKVPARNEVPERKWARRGVYAVRDLQSGSCLSTDDLIALRPNVGIGAEEIDAIVGRRLRRPVRQCQPIARKDLA